VKAIWKQFFWGPPSHKPVAWVGAAAGVMLLALPFVIAVFGTGGHPLFLAALFFVGLAETGWTTELLPRRALALAGWGRALRWLCAFIGLALAGISTLAHLAPLWFAGVLAVGAILLVFEMAPSGYANRA
jgi:hypothetical protein